MNDNVNKPQHYQGKIECIEDLKKAQWYISKLIIRIDNE